MGRGAAKSSRGYFFHQQEIGFTMINAMLFALRRLVVVLLIAVAAYCLWPRSTSLTDFDPARMAELQIQLWEQTEARSRTAMFFTLYEIFERQYRVPPIASAMMAFEISKARWMFELAPDPADQEKATEPLKTAFVHLKHATKLPFEPAVVAKMEVTTWTLVADHSRRATLTAAVSEMLAVLYNRPTSEMLPAAKLFARAMKAADEKNWTEARSLSSEAWLVLHRVVATPKS